MTNIPGMKTFIPGTRNMRNPRQYSDVPGIPGIPGCCAHVRDTSHALSNRARIVSRTRNSYPEYPEYSEQTNGYKASPYSGYPEYEKRTRNMVMSKPMRVAMPTVAGWIDGLREAFGAEAINASIRAGIDGRPVFYARENNQEVGTRRTTNPVKTIALADCQIGPMHPAKRKA